MEIQQPTISDFTLSGHNHSGTASGGAILNGYTTTATGATTSTLTSSSTPLQFFTGTSYQTVKMPLTSTLALGFEFRIHNDSTGSLTVTSSGGNYICNIPPTAYAILTCVEITGKTQTTWSSKLSLILTMVQSFPREIMNNVNVVAGAGGSDGNWTSYGVYFTPMQTMQFSSTSTMNAVLCTTTTGYYILAVYKYAVTNMQLMFATSANALGGAIANISATVNSVTNGILIPGTTYYFVMMTNANPGMGGISLGGTLALKPHRYFTQMLGNLGTGAAGTAPATISEPTVETTNGTLFIQAII